MFTGIIEEIGTITLIKKLPNCLKLSIKADIILKDIKIGDSISINGICLTVTKILQKTITLLSHKICTFFSLYFQIILLHKFNIFI